MHRRCLLQSIGGLALLAACSPPDAALIADTESGVTTDLGPEQRGRIRADANAEAIALLPADYVWANEGALTVGMSAELLPFSAYATDMKTVIGSEPDTSQLIADAFGKKLIIVPIVWADWPMGLSSAKYDVAVANVTVTELRKEKFDFSTYRQDLLGFYVPSKSTLTFKDPKDVAGLRIIVGASTNQEEILLRWNEQNVAAGLKPAELLYFDDFVNVQIALLSQRADAYLGPNATAAYAARDGRIKQVGTFSGGWPLQAEIAVATRKGSGLAEAITHALNTQIENGNYAKALARWSLDAETISESRTNPPGLPAG